MVWLNLAAFIPCTEVEGPGKRAAVWVQGCNKRCPGCCNPSYLKIVERDIVTAQSVLISLLEAQVEFGLEGVTLLGGEPFLQAQGLAVIAQGAQQHGMSVMAFTGYTLQELHELVLPGTDELLQFTDVLVDGPYVAKMPDSHRNWVGSTNQRFHYFSSRYDQTIETSATGVERATEWRVRADGSVVINGWPFSFR